MEREKSFRAVDRAAGGAADELVDGRIERQRARLDFFAQGVPGCESVFARNRRLGIMQSQIRGADLRYGSAFERGQGGETSERVWIAPLRRGEQRLRLLLQLLEVRTRGQLT